MTAVDEGFAARLRAATRDEHERAERSAFVADLLGGRLGLGAYAALLAQSHVFYGVLEEAGEHWRGDAVVGRFVIDGLLRRGALERDLAYLLGPGWRAGVRPLPATLSYVDRLREVCFTDRGAFVAHHYTRYLGDLSGGQVIRRRLKDLFGLDGDGVRFYDFDAVGKPKPFRDHYRDLLDTTAWDEDERASLISEANVAFRLNRAVFDDLGGVHHA
ncbi:biliverdin-producing heme oxygenase [Actinokineospora bangkokensis]|uniref:Biliverdin-producing heme oxygenase n=1 Tax=Actinokineospora bangkokensis TaxID=1193682 RepID=A0A1Q9LSX3_9PSEU|nr:biliverdin-producing heme oxygenase [Actinokineospora bangkokensis]OLR95136.1 biliverdin-producing heme oxygenase [Actinokineospora bangkokensis]